VTNVKKIRAEVRKAKKKFLEEKKNEDEKKTLEETLLSLQQQQSSSQQEPEVRKMKGQSLTQQQPIVKKKKKTKTQNSSVHISNEQELVDAIILLINNLPNAAKITVSAVGDKLQEMTGHSWNKKWKKNFGPLKSFLEGRKEFTVDGKDQVAVKQGKHEEPMKKQKAKKAPVVQAKQPKVKVNRPEQHTDVPARSSSKRVEVESDSSSCVRIFFVLALVIAVLLFTLISVDAGSSQYFEQIKKQFRS